jgi:Superinfection immunity protein
VLGQYSAGPEWVVILISGIFCLGLYFLPTIIAIVRKMPNTGSVFVVNLFLGWTFIGWIVALVMAAGSAQPRAALQATSTASTAPLPPPPGTATAGPTFVHIGQRYRFGSRSTHRATASGTARTRARRSSDSRTTITARRRVSTGSAHSNPSR